MNTATANSSYEITFCLHLLTFVYERFIFQSFTGIVYMHRFGVRYFGPYIYSRINQ